MPQASSQHHASRSDVFGTAVAANSKVIMNYRPLCERSCAYSAGIEVADLEDGMPCAAVKNLQSILHGIFGYSVFRPGQLDAALPALHGRDVFARMATGAGKSLVMFSVPLAHSDRAVGVIISPLISLMDEQVRKCNTQVLHCSVKLAYTHI